MVISTSCVVATYLLYWYISLHCQVQTGKCPSAATDKFNMSVTSFASYNALLLYVLSLFDIVACMAF